MSLDVYLTDRRGECPARSRGADEEQVFWANITHNLNSMAVEAGLYNVIWRPEDHGIICAVDLIKPLQDGIALLESDPERFKQFEPDNKWGTYRDFIPWLKAYLEACIKNPEARVRVSR